MLSWVARLVNKDDVELNRVLTITMKAFQARMPSKTMMKF